MKLKRYWYLTHRWLGIALCLIFAMWFFSGVVMMYVGFPSLDRDERLNALPSLKTSSISVSPSDLFTHFLLADTPTLRLTTIADRSAYVFSNAAGMTQLVFADSGHSAVVDADLVMQSAAQFMANSQTLYSDQQPLYLGAKEVDQWTVSNSLHQHRPLHIVDLQDQKYTKLYISSKTGEVVRDVNQTERVWNWLGANLHWIYPVQLRQYPSLWADVVVTLSLIACFSVITGAVIGFQRIRIRKPYRGKDYSPYRGVAKWHHLGGLFTLVFLSTYILSGLLSMNPWGVFSDKTSRSSQVQRYQMGTEPTSPLAYATTDKIHAILEERSEVKEISWHWLNGQSYIVLDTADSKPEALMTNGENLKASDIERAAMQLLPESNVTSVTTLNNYDHYYYSHHGRYRPLPAVKIVFDDPEKSWFYIDLNTGQMVDRATTRGRVQRWMYNGLHSLDFSFLIQNRPLWDLVVISLCVIGFLFSITAVWLGTLIAAITYLALCLLSRRIE